VPFVNRAARAPDRVIEPRTPADAPDPNKPLYSKNQPVPVPEREQEPAPEERASILERLFGRPAQPESAPAPAPAPAERPQAGRGEGAPIVASRPAQPPPAPAATKGEAAGGDASAASKAPGERTGYLLQAGAFRGRDEADGMRARLALLGFEARVVGAEVNGQPMYRVRVGPFAQLDDMNDARARLAENGIEASVVRQR
jgi:cell division protein FtsN